MMPGFYTRPPISSLESDVPDIVLGDTAPGGAVFTPQPKPPKSPKRRAPKPKEAQRFTGDNGKSNLSVNHVVTTLAIKCYEEQLPHGEKGLFEAIANSDKRGVQVIGIKHDADVVSDGIWKSALEKPHYHVILRFVGKQKCMRVKAILDALTIQFRPGVDDLLWTNRGVETVGNFAGYAMYLTHDTEQARQQAKTPYEVSALVSNLTPEEVEQVRAGYVRVSEKRRVSDAELVALDSEAYDIGFKLGDFQAWYDAQPFSIRSHTKMRTIRESYERGVNARVVEHREMTRLCVFIHGAPNTGKTFAATAALDGKRILTIGGGGSGKYDNLLPSHDAIIVDDDGLPNVLNVADNYVCRVYKRNKNNPVWAGRFLIVTSNQTFAEWLVTSNLLKGGDIPGFISDKDAAHYQAALSRFYICHLEMTAAGVNRLVCTSVSTRGSNETQKERLEMFKTFQEAFNGVIATYKPKADVVDYSTVLEPSAALQAAQKAS